MKNEIKTHTYSSENTDRNVVVTLRLYIDDEEELDKEVQMMLDGYNNYVYADWDDFYRDVMDAVKRHLKYSIDAE